jgi:hypothetical protein
MFATVVITIGYVSLYVFGYYYPDKFLWGVNHLAFLGNTARIEVFFIMLGLILFPFSASIITPKFPTSFFSFSNSRKTKLIISLCFGIVGTFIFYHFKIATDIYGDAHAIVGDATIPKNWKAESLLQYKKTELLSFAFHDVLSHFLNINLQLTYQIVSSLCGGIFLAIYFYFVQSQNGSSKWKTLALLVGCSSGVNQLFFGHVENYTIVYLLIIVFLILGWNLFDERKGFGLMTAIFILGVGFHLEMVLLSPALLFAFLYVNQEKYPFFKKLVTIKSLLLFLVSTFISGIILYFFVFRADILSGVSVEEMRNKIFLPLNDPLPPPHNYSLISQSHLSDFFQELLFTVSPIALIICCSAAIFHKKINWREPKKIFFLLSSLFFLLFNFTVNPLLSMVRDWDLFSLASAPIIFFALSFLVEVFSLIKDARRENMFISIILVPAILSSTIFYINSDGQKVSDRLQTSGIWAYKTCYLKDQTIFMIYICLRRIKNIDEQIVERGNAITKLMPYSTNPDPYIGFLYGHQGFSYLRKKEYQPAFQCLIKSINLDSSNTQNILFAADVAMYLKKYDEASNLYDTYNKLVNEPEVESWRGLGAAEWANYMKYMTETNADSILIQKSNAVWKAENYTQFLHWYGEDSSIIQIEREKILSEF